MIKKHLLLSVFLFKAAILFSQSQFVITGKTNFITNGKAILIRNSAAWFYPPNFKDDTVQVHNHAFLLKGALKYPAFFRLYFLDDNGNGTWSEPFFVDSGNQTLTSDSTTVIHDNGGYGEGVVVKGSKANDEYVNDFLPLFNQANKEITAYFKGMDNAYSIADKQLQRDSMAKAEAKRLSGRKISDSILYEYANKHPASPITCALLYDAAFRHYYSDYYYEAFEKISSYAPPNIDAGLRAFLDVQKLKGIGHTFPLLDFIQANAKAEAKNAKYTLVDFWFSGCGPCIRKFNELKETYKEFHEKGFNIVAISSDKKEALPNYERVIKKFQYSWDQVLDLNGVKTKSLNIHTFPTSFLLDSQGKIIETFINPILLNAFLEKNLQ